MKHVRLIAGISMAAVLLAAAPQPRHIDDFDTSPLDAASIAVLVPTSAPSDFGDVKITAMSGRPHSTEGGYLIVLGAVTDCEGGTACAYATVEGEPTRKHAVPRGYHAVKLHDGSKGYYIDGPCGANCSGSFQLVFFRGNAEYMIGIKAGRLADGLLIERGLRHIQHG